jgi:hypothetical protein
MLLRRIRDHQLLRETERVDELKFSSTLPGGEVAASQRRCCGADVIAVL